MVWGRSCSGPGGSIGEGAGASGMESMSARARRAVQAAAHLEERSRGTRGVQLGGERRILATGAEDQAVKWWFVQNLRSTVQKHRRFWFCLVRDGECSQSV